MNKRQTSAGACGELDRTAVCTATRSAVETLPAVLETIVLKTVALRAVLAAAALMLLVPSCSKLKAERANVTAGNEAIVLRPKMCLCPYGFETKALATGTDMPTDYSIFTSAYYSDSEFPETDGNYFTGIKFDKGSGADWEPATDYYWPAGNNGLNFLSVATDASVFDISSMAEWCYDNNTYGVKIQMPQNDGNTEILYAKAYHSDKTVPVDMEFEHTQCCLEFNIRLKDGEPLDMIRLDSLIVKDAYNSGELLIEFYPLTHVHWHMDSEERADRKVPDIVAGTDITQTVINKKITLVPQERRDIILHLLQLPDNTFDWSSEFKSEERVKITSESQKWLAGKKYIFNILIGFDKIIIDATVADWNPSDDRTVTI